MAFAISLLIFIVAVILALVIDFADFTFQAVNLAYFIDVSSLVMVVVPAVSFAVASASFRELRTALKSAFVRKIPSDPADVRRSAAVLFVLGNISAFMGVLGFLVGVVLLLQNLSDPSQIGPALAIALIPLVYGTIIKLLCGVVGDRLIQRITTT